MFTTSMAVHEIAICGGFYFSHPDIAGPFAGSVFGITNTMAQIPGFVNPMLVAYLTPNGTHQEWMSVFYIASSIYLFGCITYLILGSAELEPWTKLETKKYSSDSKEEVDSTQILKQ
jgi:sugar phosphate permease